MATLEKNLIDHTEFLTSRQTGPDPLCKIYLYVKATPKKEILLHHHSALKKRKAEIGKELALLESKIRRK